MATENYWCLAEGETPTTTPCPSCGRHYDGRWIAPCPEEECPSHHEENPHHNPCDVCKKEED